MALCHIENIDDMMLTQHFSVAAEKKQSKEFSAENNQLQSPLDTNNEELIDDKQAERLRLSSIEDQKKSPVGNVDLPQHQLSIGEKQQQTIAQSIKDLREQEKSPGENVDLAH